MILPHLVLFPDAEQVVRRILVDGLVDYEPATLQVSTEVSNPRPDEFVLVRRAGGVARTPVTDEATVTVETWAQSTPRAAALAQVCRGLVHLASGSVVDGVAVYAVGEFAAPAALPDPLSDQIRYRQTLTIALRGAAADPLPPSA